VAIGAVGRVAIAGWADRPASLTRVAVEMRIHRENFWRRPRRSYTAHPNRYRQPATLASFFSPHSNFTLQHEPTSTPAEVGLLARPLGENPTFTHLPAPIRLQSHLPPQPPISTRIHTSSRPTTAACTVCCCCAAVQQAGHKSTFSALALGSRRNSGTHRRTKGRRQRPPAAPPVLRRARTLFLLFSTGGLAGPAGLAAPTTRSGRLVSGL